MELVLREFKSRRNRVTLIETAAGPVIQKEYRYGESYERELLIYDLLGGCELPHGTVLSASPFRIRFAPLPGKDLVTILEEQETLGRIDWQIWDKLIHWLIAFHKETGYVMTDVNLRNFLYDDKSQILYGVDFEECQMESMAESAARLAAHICCYTPEHTLFKRKIAESILREFSASCGLDLQQLILEAERQEAYLLERREIKRKSLSE